MEEKKKSSESRNVIKNQVSYRKIGFYQILKKLQNFQIWPAAGTQATECQEMGAQQYIAPWKETQQQNAQHNCILFPSPNTT